MIMSSVYLFKSHYIFSNVINLKNFFLKHDSLSIIVVGFDHVFFQKHITKDIAYFERIVLK